VAILVFVMAKILPFSFAKMGSAEETDPRALMLCGPRRRIRPKIERREKRILKGNGRSGLNETDNSSGMTETDGYDDG
jgi:hypothetical protein